MHAAPEQFKIMVAGDSPIYRSLVESILAEAGCKVLFAEKCVLL
jgi:CheY-like chemotaxis protein